MFTENSVQRSLVFSLPDKIALLPYQLALEIASESLEVNHPSTAIIRANLKSLHDNYA